jgi:hypothetical protein
MGFLPSFVPSAHVFMYNVCSNADFVTGFLALEAALK